VHPTGNWGIFEWLGKSSYLISYLSSICIKMGVQMFVCLSVGMWRANGNPNPCTNLDEILHTYPHLSKEGFGPGLTPDPLPPGPRGLETLKAEGHIFKKLSRLQLTWAAPGTSASLNNKYDFLFRFIQIESFYCWAFFYGKNILRTLSLVVCYKSSKNVKNGNCCPC